MIHTRRIIPSAASGLALIAALPASAQEFITVASTTSTENSGLFGHILPMFQEETGIEVRVVSQGTGQALETGRRGDADVVCVHARAQEEAFVSDGYGVQRFNVMYNDFVIVGPNDDPAGLRDASDAASAMAAIAGAEASFASRGDDSGTHVAEMNLWTAAGVEPSGTWYLSTGSGMGATLNTAAQVPAYALTDRGTWLSFENRGDLEIVFEGDEVLFNTYGIILVNPERHSHVKAEQGQAFIDWIISDDGQAAISSFTVGGEQLFFPSAASQ
ncbi:substrate-binding domain-containing protein [Roseinatronobacter bogoriensis]|uniref:Sulfate transporter n=1 Tax=Roseinatronobacter bogoriensis subsp. barguzinensis TaxID=441209 RepID=A0A2K8K855_9RHOB|nr:MULTISPECIES: substrate-binding domain-containing protein [Rhodobaca]ATX65624.1 sulfate transporter [Rhodobaca barguzinensis]MBB4208439.1 tungstate transport system substrate-binding protein [Rhodobaca bogoriensis DSM 18756]TDW39081.1 tungstate transport system substrate-binding protein [Rhodobaca barguzinensis]TDY66400.1 tungstate transport system substrate-binding protein [Rhodobaca bogoriensis DSM 18756]